MKHLEQAREWIRELAYSGMYDNFEDVIEYSYEASEEQIARFVNKNWAGGLVDFERSIVAV